jgi:aminopeptidase N
VLTEGDAIVSRVAGYRVTIQAPLGWRVAATGSQVSASSRPDGQTLVFAASPVREFTLVASPNFSVEKTRLGEVTLVDWSLPDTTAEGRHKLNIAVDAMQVYNRVFGQYPYRELDIVSVPLQYASGVEFPGLVLIQNRLAPSGEEYTFLNNVIAHEVAHQWWYGVVGNDNLDSPWMDEGLATFSELLYTQAEFPEVFQQNLAIDVSAVSGFEASRGEAAIGQPLENFQGQSDAYAIIVYLKGALFFQELRDRLGEDTFQKSLKLYYRQNRFDQAEPEELLAAFEEACACDLSDLFLEWGAIYDSGG